MKTTAKNVESTWLVNSTFNSSDIPSYRQASPKIYDVNTIIESDSSNECSSKLNLSKTKKKHKKEKKKNIIQKYLKSLPNIDDKRQPYRKIVFLRDMLKNDRDTKFFFRDGIGNSQLLRYGCIYEKHISKYKSEEAVVAEAQRRHVKDRYFNKLKNVESSCVERLDESCRRRCDIHCVCRQDFIPLPFDMVVPGGASSGSDVVSETDSRVTRLNETVFSEPQNIEAWLQLVHLQDEAANAGFKGGCPTSAVSAKKVAILDKALTSNPNNLQLQLCRMRLVSVIWTPEQLDKEWEHVLFVHCTNLSVWRLYIQCTMNQKPGFSVDKVVAAYAKCFSNFHNVMSGRNKTRKMFAVDVESLVELVSELADFLGQAGWQERATAVWQANIEYNMLCQAGSEPLDHGGAADDPLMRGLCHFWESGRPRVGEAGAGGWGLGPVSGDRAAFIGAVQGPIADLLARAEVDWVALPAEQPAHEVWLHMEQTRSLAYWLPAHIEDEEADDDRRVPFSAVRPFLVTLHRPRNLADAECLDTGAARARLVSGFLRFLGVEWPTRSDRLLAELRPDPRRHGLPVFLAEALSVLRLVAPHSVPAEEMVYHVGMCMHAETARLAVTRVRQAAKRVMAGATPTSPLWPHYTRLLLAAAQHPCMASDAKARAVTLAEAGKVMNSGLLPGLTSLPSLGHQLAALGLLLRLMLLQRGNGSKDHLATLTAGLCRSRLSELSPPPTNTSVTAMSQYLGHIVDCVEEHWTTLAGFYLFYLLLDRGIEAVQCWCQSELPQRVRRLNGPQLRQLAHLLDSLALILQWAVSSANPRYDCTHCNVPAVLRKSLTPLLTELSGHALCVLVPPHLLEACIETRPGDAGAISMPGRNFLWQTLSQQCKQDSSVNSSCSAGPEDGACCLLPVSLALERLQAAADVRIEQRRVRAAMERVLMLQGTHWRHRLTVWLAYLRFEAGCASGAVPDSQASLRGVFYRAVTDMPGYKCLYLAAVSLAPELLSEAVQLMRDNKVRLCAAPEEVQLILRIRQQKQQQQQHEVTMDIDPENRDPGT